MFLPRPKQQKVLDYTGGKLGVSAVPGSGKTQTLSYLAARLVAEGGLEDEQEVLVVTLVNSAVDNFAGRVAGFVKERGLLPQVGYRVRTLHGLAHDIVRERPSLVGLADDFQLVDEREAYRILDDAVAVWLAAHPSAADDYLSDDLDDHRAEWVRRDEEHGWPALAREVAHAFIKQAKDQECTPDGLRESLDRHPESLPLLEMGLAVYADYQRALAYRGAVDFDDLIRLALRALHLDRDLLARLRHRWPYILEDEAQDSSRLQEEILRRLAGPAGNWVRVGDPNQAIFETFTTASPQYLRRFLAEPGVTARDLPNSGRSTRTIIDLANHLVAWTQAAHPVEDIRGALVDPPIEPSPPGDPQPNPTDAPAGLRLAARRFTAEEELAAVMESLTAWLPEHPEQTVAVLVPRNGRGEAVANELKRRKIEYVELLRSTLATRAAAGALGNLVRYLADPASSQKLATAYEVWRRGERDDAGSWSRVRRSSHALRRCTHVEDFLWPRVERDQVTGLDLDEDDVSYAEEAERLLAFRALVRRWQATADLPIDQIILTLAQDLFERPGDLAVAQKLALVLRGAARSHPEWRLAELSEELAVVARNERKFLGFGDEDYRFDPDQHRGKVVVATIHKAKGLEWDRVYLISANNYDFPSALPGDTFISEKRFVRGGLNLVAESLAQFKALFQEDIMAPYLDEGAATRRARYEYAAERLRLLYVGITRARRELWISWNTGRSNQAGQPAAPFIALQTWWNGKRGERENVIPDHESSTVR